MGGELGSLAAKRNALGFRDMLTIGEFVDIFDEFLKLEPTVRAYP